MSKWFGYAMVIVSFIALVGVLTFAGPCIHDDGTVAGCFGASRAILGLSIFSMVFADIATFWGKPVVKKVFAALCAMAGILMALVPGTLLPLCMMHTMRCWTTMRPFAMVCGIALALLSIASIVTQPKER